MQWKPLHTAQPGNQEITVEFAVKAKARWDYTALKWMFLKPISMTEVPERATWEAHE